MKIFGKKIPGGNFLLFLSFTTISVCIILIVSTMRKESINSLSKNALYTGHQREFSIKYSEDEKQWEQVIPKLCGKEYNNFAVYAPLEDSEKIVRGLYIKGKTDIPPMVRGKYFDESTSWSDKPYAVLGREFERDVYVRDGRRYYSYNNKEYEMLGIMGTKEDSRINYMVIIDFRSAVDIAGINKEYVLDTKKESDLYDVGGDLIVYFASPAEVYIGLDKGPEESFMEKLLSSEVIMDTMQIMILISFLLSTIIVTLIWFRFRRQMMFAWKLCGYEKYAEYIEMAKRYYMTAGVSFVAGSIIMFAIMGIISNMAITVGDIITALGMTIGFGTVILFTCYAIEKRRLQKNSKKY